MQRINLYRAATVCLVLTFCASSVFAYSLKLKGDWNEYKSDHFIIYAHPSIPNKYIKEFINKCEHYYQLITDRLGFNRFDFWLWEDRAKIFIYKTREEYLEYTKRPIWSGASVHIKKKHINTFYFEKDFFDLTLPHELAHIILREFIGLKADVPLWFDEGVASVNEKDSILKYLVLAKGFVGREIYMAVPEMEKVNEHKVKFPTVFYATAASLVIFLLEDYKSENFVFFCREIRDGSKFYDAMEKIYAIKDAADLNTKFVTYLENKGYSDIINREDFSVQW